MLKLILVRHAATKANEAGLYIGRSESPLSDKGREAARRLCKKLENWEIDEIYTSPSGRTKETIAPLVGRGHTLQVIEALQEIDFGSCEMKDFGWLKENHPEEMSRMMEEGILYQYPQGESLAMLHERVAHWLNSFLKEHSSGTYLVVAHGGTIRCILSQLLVKNASLHWHFKIDPAAITIIHIEDDFPVIQIMNETC